MYEQVKQLLMTSFQVAENEITPQAGLRELGLDSLDIVELAMAVEQFGVRVTDDELSDRQLVGAIAEFIEHRMAAVS